MIGSASLGHQSHTAGTSDLGSDSARQQAHYCDLWTCISTAIVSDNIRVPHIPTARDITVEVKNKKQKTKKSENIPKPKHDHWHVGEWVHRCPMCASEQVSVCMCTNEKDQKRNRDLSTTSRQRKTKNKHLTVAHVTWC